jgi:hypothetical protein
MCLYQNGRLLSCAVQPICDQTAGESGYHTCCTANGVACGMLQLPANAACCGGCDTTAGSCVSCVPLGHGTCSTNAECCAGSVCDTGEGKCELCDSNAECGAPARLNCKLSSGACCTVQGMPCGGLGSSGCCSGLCSAGTCGCYNAYEKGCVDDDGCCSGLVCDTDAGTPGICGPGCRFTGQRCTLGTGCCTGHSCVAGTCT